jgi:hypothetical protein
MGAIDDQISRIVRRAVLPGQLSREVAAGAETLTGVSFDQAFYEKVRGQAAHWKERAGDCTKLAVLVPAGLFAIGAGFGLPDRDISLLGIGRHRFFLFHSAIGVWMLGKIYEAHLARRGKALRFRDRVVHRIIGITGAGLAFGVGCHLLMDVCQPKAVIFPCFGSLVESSLVDDNLWLLGNAVWCFKVSRDFFVLALGDDLARVKAYVRKTFGEPHKEGIRDAVFGRR